MELSKEEEIQLASPDSSGSNLNNLNVKVKKPYTALLALSRVSAAVSGLWDLNAVLNVALDTMLDIMNGTIGYIMLVDEQSQSLSLKVLRGLPEKYAPDMRLKIGEGIGGKVVQTGRAVLVEDLSEDPRAVWRDLINAEGLKAFLSVPLRAKDTVLGVLNVASRLPHHFTQDDMHLLHAIGDQVGVAIEQAELYNQLRKERENYRQLARYMLITQEAERGRVARELHDETSQSLTGLSLNMQAILNIAKASNFGDDAFRTKLEQAHNITFQLNSEINKIMKSLRPTALDSLGLGPAVHQYAENRLQPAGIKVLVKQEGMEERLPSEVEFGLYRIAQGSISNIAWHSQAKNAVIDIECTSDELIMQIEDDGQGFDASQPIEVDGSGRGRGLLSMKERASLLGGTCDIQSTLGKGTKIIVKVPVYWDKTHAKDQDTDSR
ncbi:MAG: GAF domain-containing sensor histidine kinase [Dehalococcoidia bacterium]|nr:GAF domain-containing sensor histidine kinase [Dehalococcoidia bacterium]